MYHAGVNSYSAGDFCTLFLDTCSNYLITAANQGTQAACAATYGGLPSSAKICRSIHLCNATGAGMQTPHCYHAQGWDSATTQPGGPCN
jgi:hypothetical protein